MLRLTRVRAGDRGAIATIVAMLFFFGVMLALGALTVDVGNINADRRQLQNGADAVALAVAQQCAQDGTCQPIDPLTSKLGQNLQDLANANAADNATSIRRVDGQTPVNPKTELPETDPAYPAICGDAPGLDKCGPWDQSMSNLQECPSTPSGVNYVRVYAETKNSADNRNILPYYFGAAITGIEGANQQACATVTYGPPSGAAAPITLSYCEWAAATGNSPDAPVPGAGTYAADPVYPDPVGTDPGYGGGGLQPAWPTPAPQLPLVGKAGQEIIISLQGTEPKTVPTKCASWNGHDAPGGFGYLASSTSCTGVAAVGGWMHVDTGNTLPGGCTSLFPYFNTVLYLPVFDCTVKVTGTDPIPTGLPLSTYSCIDGAGSNTYYHVMGYAKFYLSGYRTSGSGVPDKNNDRTQAVTPRAPCDGANRCLSGWFLQGLVDAPQAPPQPPGSPSLGAYSIKLAG